MKKILGSIVLALFSIFLLIPNCQAKSIKLRIGYDMPPFTVPGIGIKAWADEIQKSSNGQISVEVYPSNSLSDQKSAIDMLRNGVADGYLISLGMNRKLFPTVNVHALPGLSFPDTTKGYHAHANTLDQLIEKYPSMAKEMKDFKIVFNVINGNFILISKKPISGSPLDIQGKKVGGSGVRLTLIQQLGGAGVYDVPPISYQNLQTGVIEASTAHFMGIGELKIYEVANHAIDVSLGQSGLPLVLSKRSWNRLSKDHQNLILSAAKVGQRVTYGTAEERTELGKKAILNSGGSIHTLTSEERKMWEEEFKKIWNGWIKEREQAGVKSAALILGDWKKAVDQAWNL